MRAEQDTLWFENGMFWEREVDARSPTPAVCAAVTVDTTPKPKDGRRLPARNQSVKRIEGEKGKGKEVTRAPPNFPTRARSDSVPPRARSPVARKRGGSPPCWAKKPRSFNVERKTWSSC